MRACRAAGHDSAPRRDRRRWSASIGASERRLTATVDVAYGVGSRRRSDQPEGIAAHTGHVRDRSYGEHAAIGATAVSTAEPPSFQHIGAGARGKPFLLDRCHQRRAGQSGSMAAARTAAAHGHSSMIGTRLGPNTIPHPEERPEGSRLEGWATTMWPPFETALAASQGEVNRDRGGFVAGPNPLS